MSDPFVHLHVHTEYSMLDGAARTKDIFAEVERTGTPAVAMTDHGNMHGAYDFYTQATAAGVTPVLGVEAYVAPESRFTKERVRWGRLEQKSDDVSGGGAYTHMTIWARNAEGLHNLFRLNSLASMEGHYIKWPRMDAELLSQHSAGLMATTGCPSGEVQTRLRLGQTAEALAAASKYQDIFGRDNFFLEIMDHGLDIERRVRDGLVDIGNRLGIEPVVTNDSHYTYEHQANAHDVLLCVQTNSQVSDPDRFRFGGSGYYLKPAADMYAIDSSGTWQTGCRNTLMVAERVDTTGMFSASNLMPRITPPDGHTESSWFRHEVWRGMADRYPDGIPDQHRAQAEYEIGVIEQMGFASYFLVVADFIGWAKSNGIAVGPGRGSGAGSIVAYAMGITDLDPLKHGLIFERFLNPERVSMPDFDIDFDERRRGEVIGYVVDKYGRDHVAYIATYGTIKAKAAIKDASRVLGYPYAVGDRITKAMPPAVMGKDIPLSGILDTDHPRYKEAGEIRGLYESDDDVRKVIDTAAGIEGLIRQTGVHAAGVIMSAEPLIDHVPLMQRSDDGAIITQFDYPTCETLGLLKMDFLGLRNLTIASDAVDNVEKTTGTRLDLLELPLDDQPTYDLLARGDTLGVFQLDGGQMRALLRQMKPDCFADISATIALYRPGPMGAGSHTNYALRKNGQQPITPIHAELADACDDILGETYGLIVYQEQVQRLAQKLAGYSLGKADLLRRAMGKKKREVLDAEFVGFCEGMKARGYSEDATTTLWDILVPFADYAFNKAHSAAYGMIAYQTAYLKANYPAEYMAALLTSVAGDKDRMALYLAECRHMGIKVLPPDVNDSHRDFTPIGTDIRFGLNAIRNIGSNVVDAIVTARADKGGYTSFHDFMDKIPVVACNKRVIDSLVRAGAFDAMAYSRRALAAIVDDTVDAVVAVKRAESVGQYDLFGSDDASDLSPTVPDLPEWDSKMKLANEREMLGLYVSGHPLNGIEDTISRRADTTVAAVNDETSTSDGQTVSIAGVLTGVARRVTKAGRAWATANVEDLTGIVEVLVFPATYDLVHELVAEDNIVTVQGRVDRRDEQPRIIAGDLAPIDTTPGTSSNQPVSIVLPTNRCTPPVVDRLKDVLTTHPGPAEVHIRLTSPTTTTVLRVQHTVAPTPELIADLKALLGPHAIARATGAQAHFGTPGAYGSGP